MTYQLNNTDSSFASMLQLMDITARYVKLDEKIYQVLQEPTKEVVVSLPILTNE